MWSTNPDGIEIEMERESWVTRSREHATSLLASNLVQTASDEFLYAALSEWFTKGRIDKLSECVDDSQFWNVVLVDDDGTEVPSKA
jgi:hypothetical protein